MILRTLMASFLFASASALAAPPATETDSKAFDKSVIATLREIHDRGADLYNMSKDFSAAYRLYEGSLLTVKPLLSHRPDVQKTINDGLEKAGREPDASLKAFILHEVIEKVRMELKGVTPKSVEPTPTPKVKEPTPMPKAKEPTPTPPKAKGDTGSVSGKVTVQGKPLAAGTVTFVSADKKSPKVASAPVKDGDYSLKDLPVGKYLVAVSSDKAGAVPAKFATTDTSGLTYQAAEGAGQFNIELK